MNIEHNLIINLIENLGGRGRKTSEPSFPLHIVDTMDRIRSHFKTFQLLRCETKETTGNL